MRTFFFLFLLLCCNFLGFAQPTLTQATNAPVAGDAFIRMGCNPTGQTPGASGPGVVWDYSLLTPTTSDTLTYIACLATPFCDSFAGASIATHLNADGVAFTYYATDSTGFSYLGDKSSLYPKNELSVPSKVCYYPLSYSSSHYDSSVNRDYYESDTFSCDGYGTLQTPAGVYANVLRVHKKIVGYYLRLGVRSSLYASEEYFWYQAGFHNPLLAIGLDSFGATTFRATAISYYKQGTLGASNFAQASEAIKVWPNPAADYLELQSTVGSVDYVLLNAMGSVLISGTLQGSTKAVDISALSSGLYTLRLVTNAGVWLQKVEKR